MNARGNSRGGGQARDHFDQGHQRRRVEEVHANHLVRALQPGGEAGDGQRRSVAGEDAVGGAQGFQLAEQRLLDLQVLDDGLDHQMSIGQGFEGVYRAQPGAYGFRSVACILPFPPGGQVAGLCRPPPGRQRPGGCRRALPGGRPGPQPGRCLRPWRLHRSPPPGHCLRVRS